MIVVDFDETLDVDDLPLELEPDVPAAAAGPVDMNAGLAALVGKRLDDVERIFITETLRLTGGNREQAAGLLGIGERTLYRKIKDYGQ